jgi:hypothetical protein
MVPSEHHPRRRAEAVTAELLVVGTDVDPVAARSSGGEATFEVCRRAGTDNGAFPIRRSNC